MARGRWWRCVAGILLALAAAAGLQGTAAAATGDAVAVPQAPPATRNYTLGALVVTNSPAWGEILPRAATRGVLVLAIAPGTPAADAHLARGDVIVAINDQEVADSSEYTLYLQRVSQPTHRLSIVSPQGDVRSVSVALTTKDVALAPYLASLDATNHDSVNQFLVAGTFGDANRAFNATTALVEDHPAFGLAHVLHARRVLDSLRQTGGSVISNDGARLVANDVFRAVEVAPEEPDVLVGAAEILLSLGDPATAEKYGQSALQFDPGSTDAHEVLGNSRLALGRPEDALVELRRAVELGPYNPQYYRAMSRAYRKVGNTTAAASTDALAGGIRPQGGSPAVLKVQTGVGLAVITVVALAIASVLVQRRWSADEPRRAPRASSADPAVLERRQVPGLEMLGLVGLWAVAIPLLAPLFGVSQVSSRWLEVVNYFIPGCALVFVSVLGLRRWFSGRPGGQRALAAYAAVGLACALWILATQGQTILRAVQGSQAGGAPLLYSSAGVFAAAVSCYLVWISTRQGRVAVGP